MLAVDGPVMQTLAVPLPADGDPRASALASEAVRTRFALTSFRHNGDEERRGRVAAHLRAVRAAATAADLPLLARVLQRCEALVDQNHPFADARFMAMDVVLRDIGYRRAAARIPAWMAEEDAAATAAEELPIDASPLELVLRATEGKSEAVELSCGREASVVEELGAVPEVHALLQASHVDGHSLLEALVTALTHEPPPVLSEVVHDTDVDASVALRALAHEAEAALEALSIDIVFSEPPPRVSFALEELSPPAADVTAPMHAAPQHEMTAPLTPPPHVTETIPPLEAPLSISLTPPPRPRLLSLTPPAMMVVQSVVAAVQKMAPEARRSLVAAWSAPDAHLAGTVDEAGEMRHALRPLFVLVFVILGLLSGLGIRALAYSGQTTDAVPTVTAPTP